MAVPEPVSEKKTRGRERDKWRDLISDEDMPLVNSIREWRGERAKQDGVTPYVICTNMELAHMVKKKLQNLNKLSETEGFGKAKVEEIRPGVIETAVRAGR